MHRTIGLRVILGSALTVLASLPSQARAGDDPTADDRAAAAAARHIDVLIEPLVHSDNVPALAGLELHGDRIVAIGASGVRALGHPERVTIFDEFHLGSDTKAMTATLCAMLVEEGKLKWTTTLEEIFPKLRQDMLPNYRHVTLQQLLWHRSGFPTDMPTGLLGRLRQLTGSPADQRLFFIKQIVSQPPVAAPGEKFMYSNTNYMIAGAMAEQVTGKTWEELITRKLFDPLHMTTAGFGAPGQPGAITEPRGHTAQGKPLEPGPNADNPVALFPAGGVHCSLIDWAKFIALHLTDGKSHPGLLTPESFATLHRPIVNKPPDGYAMGWIVTSRPWAGGTTYTHTGSNTYWLVTVWIAPQKDFAILVACNRADPDNLGFKACDDLIGVLVKDYNEHEGR